MRTAPRRISETSLRLPAHAGSSRGTGQPPDFSRFAEELRTQPGWQRERMYNFHDVLRGAGETDLVDDGWTNNWPRTRSRRPEPPMTMEEFAYQSEVEDFAVMEEHRARIDEIVTDPEKAEVLKPYYRYVCKRPCFHDEFLPAFNRSNVTLVDCPAGIERITETGLDLQR